MDIEYKDDILFCRLKGSLTRRKISKVESYLIPVLLKHKVKKVVINLQNIERIDESGINELLKIKWISKINRGKIYFICSNMSMKLTLKKLNKRLHKSEESIYIQ